jgi:hypothetical protein
MLFFLERSVVVPCLARRIGFLVVLDFLVMLDLLVAGVRRRITRKCCEHRQAEDASQRTEALVHSVIPREHNGMSHQIARSVRLERHGSYHHHLLASVTHRQQQKEKLRHNGTKIMSKKGLTISTQLAEQRDKRLALFRIERR